MVRSHVEVLVDVVGTPLDVETQDIWNIYSPILSTTTKKKQKTTILSSVKFEEIEDMSFSLVKTIGYVSFSSKPQNII